MRQRATVSLIKCTATERVVPLYLDTSGKRVGVCAFEGMLLLKLPNKQWLCYKVVQV